MDDYINLLKLFIPDYKSFLSQENIDKFIISLISVAKTDSDIENIFTIAQFYRELQQQLKIGGY